MIQVWCHLATKSSPTLCCPKDCSLPGSSVHVISLLRILEWIAISFSRRSSRPRDWTSFSCIGRWILYCWATREAWYRYVTVAKYTWASCKESNRGAHQEDITVSSVERLSEELVVSPTASNHLQKGSQTLLCKTCAVFGNDWCLASLPRHYDLMVWGPTWALGFLNILRVTE